MLKRRYVVTAAFDASETGKRHEPTEIPRGAQVFADIAFDGPDVAFDIDGQNYEVEREVFECSTRAWKRRQESSRAG